MAILITDDFSGSLSNWNDNSSVGTITGGQLVIDGADTCMILYDSTTISGDRWIRAQITNVDTNSFDGMMFVLASDASGNATAVHICNQSDFMRPRNDVDMASWAWNDETSLGTASIGAGNTTTTYVGVTFNGTTGAVNIFYDATATEPTDLTHWNDGSDTADKSYTSAYGVPGNYVGLGAFSGAAVSVDNFSAGDFSSGATDYPLTADGVVTGTAVNSVNFPFARSLSTTGVVTGTVVNSANFSLAVGHTLTADGVTASTAIADSAFDFGTSASADSVVVGPPAIADASFALGINYSLTADGVAASTAVADAAFPIGLTIVTSGVTSATAIADLAFSLGGNHSLAADGVTTSTSIADTAFTVAGNHTLVADGVLASTAVADAAFQEGGNHTLAADGVLTSTAIADAALTPDLSVSYTLAATGVQWSVTVSSAAFSGPRVREPDPLPETAEPGEGSGYPGFYLVDREDTWRPKRKRSEWDPLPDNTPKLE